MRAGSRAACVKITNRVFSTAKSLNYCVNFIGKKIRNTWKVLK
jgi:hypothetical protein